MLSSLARSREIFLGIEIMRGYHEAVGSDIVDGSRCVLSDVDKICLEDHREIREPTKESTH